MHIDAQIIQDVLIGVTFVGGTLVYFKTRLPKQAVKNLQETIDSYVKLDASRQNDIKELKTKLEEALKLHADEKLEWTGAIKKLEGQIQVYKELPLRELADGIKEVVKVSQVNAASNEQILAVLQRTSIINAEDRDVLTNQNKHIRTEVHRVMDQEIKPQ